MGVNIVHQSVRPKIVQMTIETVKIIQQRLRTAQSRYKSYADSKRRPMEFKVGDRVFVKVSPSKGIVRFGKRGKLNPRYVGPFEVIGKVGTVAYRLALSQELEHVHDVFHVSMLRLCVSTKQVITPEPLEIREDLTYVEHPVEILGWKDKVLRTKTVQLVMVLWQNQSREEATWKRADEMREKYPWLFN